MSFVQFQHYIPQFMVRRFSVAQPIDPPEVSKSNRRREKEHLKYISTVKVLHLGRLLPEITSELVRKTFGQRGMYNDGLDDRIEKKLAKIEHSVSHIIARVVVAQQTGKKSILLLRSEKDLLHKFQFIMRYRSPVFFHRFNHQTAEDYSSDDRDDFLKYMRSKNLQSPREVWFDNLSKMIDIPMDPECHWIAELRETIYLRDADWFVDNIRSKYMAFVTPSDPEEEFILTENAFSIHEGPVSCFVNRFTGEKKRIAYPEFHLLTVISPRLAIVFRDRYLPEPHEDQDPERRKDKLLMLAVMAQIHADPEHATSLLEDLPVARARKSYTTLRNRQRELAQGADREPGLDDEFDFDLFPLESKHVQTINTMMLDEAYKSEKLAFKSEAALLKAIEFYLEYPCLTRGPYSRKTVSDKPDDLKLRFLKNMQYVARMLGSSVTAKYHVDPLWEDGETMSLEIAVAIVLATIADTAEKDPIVLGTDILVNTLIKMNTNITVKNKSDQIQDSLTVFPDAVYRCIQKTCREDPGPRTNRLLKIDRRSLILSWVGIFNEAIGNSENGDVPATREKLRQFVADMYADNPQESERSMDPESGFLLQTPESQQDSSLEFSRQGLSRAFEDIGRDMERIETPSSAQRLADQSFSHSTADVVESKEESNPAQPSEEMETKDDVSPDDALAAAPVVLPNYRYWNITPLDWKLNVFGFFFLLPALPLMWLAFTLIFRPLAIMSFACAPAWLAFRMGALDALHDQEPLPAHLKYYVLFIFCTILWWFTCYWFLLPDWLPNELPSGLTVACLIWALLKK